MRFFKGQIPWNKDLKGIYLSPGTEFKKGLIPWNKIKHVDKICLKCNNMFSVKPSLNRIKYCSKECYWDSKKGKTNHRKGMKASLETRVKQRLAKIGIRGEDHWNYRGYNNRTERQILMSQDEYIQWRKEVFERDNYTCQECNKRGGYLEADHIKPWFSYPELRYELSNGRTLCRECHLKTPTWGSRIKTLSLQGGLTYGR